MASGGPHQTIGVGNRYNDGHRYPRWSDEYEKGLGEYLNNKFASQSRGNQITCPCKHCEFWNWYNIMKVREHVICNGLSLREEKSLETPFVEDMGMQHVERDHCEHEASDHGEGLGFGNNLDGLLNDLSGPNEEATKFYKLVEDGQQELYPGCKTFSKLSFTIRLFLYKSDHKLSIAAFTELHEIIKDILPEVNLPSSFNEAKNLMKVLGLDYTKIDACPNDCMLYWEDQENANSCYKCKASRWKSVDGDDATCKSYRIPLKVLRYFPIKKRLQRLFMCPEIARCMIWHAKGRPKDGLMRHFADGDSWKKFDSLYPCFASDDRSLRLGLATDGFSPFNMGTVHSTWPVVLINYNLPPWLCMKPEFLMLTLLIPRPLSPVQDIDIYLQPLIKDIKELWEIGMDTYDAFNRSQFNLRAALVSTVSDFPALAMLLGWSTKGMTACPVCHYETCSIKLYYSRKTVYMCHRRLLEEGHPLRYDKRRFNGEIEERTHPIPLSGAEILDLLCDWKNDFGKGRKKKPIDPEVPWRKNFILFDLPYWKDIVCRHNLDVMHIEKNVFDNVLNTLLGIPNKSKDHVNARKDLKELNLMPELWLKELEGGGYEMPKARFLVTLDQKRLFCQVIKNAKLPISYASNIARCVKVHERKFFGYKSHDAHFMMQNLLPITARLTLPKDVALPLIKLSTFFKNVYRKVIDPNYLRDWQSEIVETLCELETIFPPSFFNIMEHLTVHLVDEIRLGGPVTRRNMYAIERYLQRQKSNTRNKSQPEGSMAEAHLLEEFVAFFVRYLKKESKETSMLSGEKSSLGIFTKRGHPLKGRGRATTKV